MLEAANGVDSEPVADRTLPKTIGCSKTFRMQNVIPYSTLREGPSNISFLSLPLYFLHDDIHTLS
jgi:hypothetical protein